MELESWLQHISAQHWQTIDMGLDRMSTMVKRMRLQSIAPTIVTIAGTNGKGSTAVGLETLLISAGCRVGTTVSPHIKRFNERIRLQGSEVEDSSITAAFATIEAWRQDLPLTYFEYSALAALHIFQQAQVDVAILEIGLGGRLDAFNAVDADVAVITSIDLDHMEFLGDNVEQIGAEKAGILRHNQNVVLGPGMPDSVLRAVKDLQLTSQTYGVDFAANDVDISSGTTIASQNLAVALAAAKFVLPKVQAADWQLHLTDLQIQQWHGRCDVVEYKQRRWVFDVGHNPAGMRFLVAQLRRLELEPKVAILGMWLNKDHAEVAQVIDDAFAPEWLLISTIGERALAAKDLRLALPATLQSSSTVCESAEAGVAQALESTQLGEVILVFGSFNTLEQFDWWHSREST